LHFTVEDGSTCFCGAENPHMNILDPGGCVCFMTDATAIRESSRCNF